MVCLLLNYLLCFVVGLLAKFTDWQVDEKLFVRKNLQYVSGALYGLGAGFLLTQSSSFASLVIAITIGVLLGGKIDHRAHQYSLAMLFGAMAFWGVPPINAFFVGFLLVFALLDEALNDLFAAKKLPLASFVARHRLLLDFGALLLSLYSGDWTYFIALVCFDVGYQLVDRVAPSFFKRLPGTVGHHLLLDLYDCNVKKLEDGKHLKRFLLGASKLIGMRLLAKPVVKRVKRKRDEGLTGFALVQESHVSVHTYPRFATAHVDVFSCKPFDAAKVEAFAKKFFGSKNVVSKTIERREDK